MIKRFSRTIVIITIISLTSFFGLYSIPNIFGVEVNDLCLVIILIYSIHLLVRKPRLRKVIFQGYFTKWFVIFIFIVLITGLSMYFRSTGSLFTGLKVGRLYFILLISIPIIYDIIKCGNSNFWEKLILRLGIFYSLIIYLNLFLPSFTQSFFTEFSYMYTEDAWGTSSVRRVVKSNYGLLFIHVSFIMQIIKVLNNKKKITLLEIALFGAMLFQGWRAILIAVLVGLTIVLFILELKERRNYFKKIIKYGLVILIITIPIDFVSKGAISSKFVSAYQEISGEKKGTLAGRYNRAEIYVIPKYLEKPLFGYGFISEKEKTKEIEDGQKSYDKTELLYNFDFGYLTMLIMFGLVGLTIILVLFVKIFIAGGVFIKKKGLSIGVTTFCIFLFSLVIANYSFGGLISYTGLMPLGILLGLGQGDMVLRNKIK